MSRKKPKARKQRPDAAAKRKGAAAAQAAAGKKLVLHVGCGAPNPEKLHKRFRGPEWREVRMDIDARVKPDIVGDMTDMRTVEDGAMDAVYSSHNVEHLHAHRVPAALKEFQRVLKAGGFLLITLPDIQAVARHVAEGNLEGRLYDSPSGPISALDIMYGHIRSVAAGNEFMAHKTAFTGATLALKLKNAGFGDIRVQRTGLELWAVAHKPAQGGGAAARRADKVILIDPEKGATGLRDDLDMPPARWKPPGLKRG